jgi:hypothetical protein
MFNFIKRLKTEPRENETYSWKEIDLGYIYVSNKNRKILYRIQKTNEGYYQVEILNNVPEVIGTFLDLDAAKVGAERNWVDLNTWIS